MTTTTISPDTTVSGTFVGNGDEFDVAGSGFVAVDTLVSTTHQPRDNSPAREEVF